MSNRCIPQCIPRTFANRMNGLDSYIDNYGKHSVRKWTVCIHLTRATTIPFIAHFQSSPDVTSKRILHQTVDSFHVLAHTPRVFADLRKKPATAVNIPSPHNTKTSETPIASDVLPAPGPYVTPSSGSRSRTGARLPDRCQASRDVLAGCGIAGT